MTRVRLVSSWSVIFGICAAVSAHAAPVCHSVPECREVIRTARLQISAAEARLLELQPEPPLGPLVRDNYGQVVTMNHDEAMRFCAARGTRLPTIRELAQALNPRGFVGETPAGGRFDPSLAGFSPTQPDNEAPFYYQQRVYEPLYGDEGNYFLWSSSSMFKKPLVFGRRLGDLGMAAPQNREGGAVRCVR
jgi:hypothetical protein